VTLRFIVGKLPASCLVQQAVRSVPGSVSLEATEDLTNINNTVYEYAQCTVLSCRQSETVNKSSMVKPEYILMKARWSVKKGKLLILGSINC
jgi:hypothetical protein